MSDKLRIVKDRAGVLARPWHVQTPRGVTLASFASFASWRLAWEHACGTVAARPLRGGAA